MLQIFVILSKSIAALDILYFNTVVLTRLLWYYICCWTPYKPYNRHGMWQWRHGMWQWRHGMWQWITFVSDNCSHESL